MNRHSITLFMWGYQPHFRFFFEELMNSVMKVLGVDEAGVKCLLVGARVPDAKVDHDVCVEPEDGSWPLSLFDGLVAAIEEHERNHPLKDIFYGDEPSMRDKVENIRRDSVCRAVRDALAPYDAKVNVRSFAGAPAPVGGYYVVPVLQVPEDIFERFRPLREPITDGHFTGFPGLIHAAVSQVLSEAHDELLRPDPGRYLSSRSRSAGEIVRRAASTFMYTLVLAIGDRPYVGHNLFERLNLISSLMYEGTEGRGLMLLATLDSGSVEVALTLAEPVAFSEPRWARKVLQMASPETALLANADRILGLGNTARGIDPWKTQNIFQVEFHDHYHWSLSCGDEILLVSRYGVPSLPQDRFPKVRLVDTFERLFPGVTAEDIDSFTALFDAAVEQSHGSMLVVARDAHEEAARLGGQGTKVTPTKLTPALYRRVSNIDGTIIIDPKCICHAVGVILDGPANEHCTPSRGARYNSGIRYVASSTVPRLAVVVSDDRSVDVIPVLRPRIRRGTIEEHVAKLEVSNTDNYHPVVAWLDDHRFYLDQFQCGRVNAALKRIESKPMEVGELRTLRADFWTDPAFTEDYFETEGN